MPQRSLGTPHITGSTPDELRISVQFWMQQLFNHVDQLTGARGTPKLLADVDANNHNIVNLPDPTARPVDDPESMAAVPRKFATPLVRQPDGSFAWDCRFIPMINDVYASDMTGVPPLQQITEMIAAATQTVLPTGVIMLWSGTVATIPSGWALCDGTSGTPDLRGRFLVGAGGAYTVGMTGGSDTVNLAHTHSADGTLATGVPSTTTTVDNDLAASTVAVASSTHTHDVTGDTATALSATSDNRPAFYALAYIMKL